MGPIQTAIYQNRGSHDMNGLDGNEADVRVEYFNSQLVSFCNASDSAEDIVDPQNGFGVPPLITTCSAFGRRMWLCFILPGQIGLARPDG
jgi:hypothetical protein